jgi:glutaredoxin-related protein
VLKPLLLRLTGSSDIPILLIGGKTVGTFDEIRYMYHKGDLSKIISAAGAIVDGGKKKKGRKH